MQKLLYQKTGKEEPHNRNGNRIPSCPIICTISETDGVQIDICEEDIYAYEVWSESSETCIASYTDETDFIQHIFSIPGTYEIRLITEDYIFVGYISTL